MSGIYVINAFLTLLTLGLYYFWGKVKILNYLSGQTEFEGDRFAFHGTGKELLLGFIKAVFAFGLISLAFQAVVHVPGGIIAQAIVTLIAYGGLILLIALAIVGSRRYRLSRVSWRGIRFSMRGRSSDFLRVYLKGICINFLALGLIYPYFVTLQYAFLTSNSYFGNERFNFDGKWQELMGSFLIAVALFIPTFGLSWFWFMAKKHRYLWNHTTFAQARFRSNVRWDRLFFLKLGNLVLLVLSLGLARPWVIVRNIRFNLKYLTLEGPLDLAAIQQEAQEASPTGEGLDTLLDLDSGLSMA